MAIIKEHKRINPLDQNRNVTIGVGFPIDEKNFFQGTKTVSEQNKANLINLLLTQPGERVNLPNYGIGIKKYLFESNLNLDLLKIRTENQIKKHISNMKLEEIIVKKNDDNEHILHLTVVYRNLLNNKSDVIQLNFR